MGFSDGGLYKNVKMSVKTADIIIIIGIAVLIVVTSIMVSNGGFIVQFDTNGGTVVESQKVKYGETIETAAPTRQGYNFAGWYLDREFTVPWQNATDTVTQSITLYAKWE